MSTLVVVAHPDDEALGFGASGALLAARGEVVTCCFLAGGVTARGARPASEELLRDSLHAQEILGFSPPIMGDFPNIGMNAVPHLDLVQFIENAIQQTQASSVITHHPHDINDDHRQVCSATLAASRLNQRQPNGSAPPLSQLLFMEVLSSTEWQFRGGGDAFVPDTYVEIGEDGLERKIEAVSAYRGVMRPYPHPRSPEAIRAQAVMRGAQAGLNLAEAFVTGFRNWHIDDLRSDTP